MSEQRKFDRRKTESRNGERRKDTLSPALRNVSARELDAVLNVRDARIEIRWPSTIKDEIEVTAGRYGLTVTTYLLRLHELARSKISSK